MIVDEATNDLIYLPLTGDPGVIVDEATNDLIYLPLPLNR